MVLEPLSAFSVACNILQVVEVGVKVLSKAAAYRKAETGVLDEQKDLRDVSQTLINLNTDLQASLPSQTESNQRTVEESRLLEASNQCLRLSKELIEFLDRLKLKEKHVVLDSLRVSIKSMWHKDKMDAMEKALSSSRDNLNIAFLVHINSKHAYQIAHIEASNSTSRVEGNVLNAVSSVMGSLQNDIKSLAQRLDDNPLASVQQIITEFRLSHRDMLEQLSHHIDSIFVQHRDRRSKSFEDQTAAANQSIIDSLYFPQMHARKDHVLEAHNGTYRWVLEPMQGREQHWDDFLLWLSSTSVRNNTYWIHGKIGSGKTTLLRFIDDHLNLLEHASPWANDITVIRASCFFWSAGNKLQKSTTGLLRTLLSRFFMQTPDLIARTIPLIKWKTALLNGNHAIDWTDSELQECFREYITQATKSRKVFILVDGLDELEGSDEMREALIDLLLTAAAHENVKVCVSSRPWNIFRDSFGSCPQLKLEDITYDDVSTYVREQLHSSKRFQTLLRYEKTTAEHLVESLISKAAGVFLWVRLVVKQLLRGLRDGDGIRALSSEMVDEIPADLNDYFLRLMESIEPQHRQEASKLFQLALYKDSGCPNTLLDFSFIEETRPDFAINSGHKFPKLDLTDAGAMSFRLESTVRIINSRCMGLLECEGGFEEILKARDFLESEQRPLISAAPGHTKDVAYTSRHPEKSDITDEATKLSSLTVDALHRSLHDFLLTPKVQSLLHHHTQGPYDSSMYFWNARLVQLEAFIEIESEYPFALALADDILSTFSRPEYRKTQSAANTACIIRPMYERLIRKAKKEPDKMDELEIREHFNRRPDNDITFLTWAIDFGKELYVRANLTRESVLNKRGRPILDNVLRPCPGGLGDEVFYEPVMPNLELLKTVLDLGAEPNQLYEGISVWALFIRYIESQADRIVYQIEISECREALEIMIERGATVLLPRKWVAHNGDFRTGATSCQLRPVCKANTREYDIFAVSDILGYYSDYLGLEVDAVKPLVLQREAELLASNSKSQAMSAV